MRHFNKIDETTIYNAQKGDTEAFGEIYIAYYRRVYFIAFQYFQNEETAKDIVQDVFIKVYTKIKDLNDPVAFPTWIQRVTYRTCMNFNRRKLNVTTLGKEMTVEDFSDFKAIDVSDVMENERIKNIIIESLESMKIPLKSVGLLRFFEGLKVNEIADILNIPKGTVNSRMNKIRKILKEDLQRNGISPKNYGFILLSPAMISSAYEALSQRYVMDGEISNHIFETVISTTASSTTVGLALSTKLMLGILAPVTLAGVLVLTNQDSPEPVIEEEISKPQIATESTPAEEAVITTVNYSDEWTNDGFQINVSTSNGEYDQILINGMNTNYIKENGVYEVQLIKNNEVIDTRTFEITNIDVHSPTGSEEHRGNEYVIYLQDDLSQIDYENILFYRDGVLSNDYTYHKDTDTLTVKEKYTTDKFYISDYAGNVLEITVY
ncbi:RNA polymerase sigma factor [Breznakia pachnodae]|uniref:RNA polymerase sigma factor (Sigma-70 family) n=1 Tax=Breznakia pachnodae TaxID=265178 RepID=A0ABU0E4F7_9FIRM|nr:sigma-70 family RNA polymerase sigma factor [Breznakia pachnodae]MDQ0361695.1 RNA polymerase sigma factor (sigma-70 family) [Breznakia pachnodae]